MSERWGLGLVAVLLIGSVVLAVIWQARRADILPKRPHAGP